MPEISSGKTRIVTAAALFDGHDAAINIMRRIMQSKGAEIIHLGHNRSVHEIVECAIEEDAHAIAITSYQGGHTEFFKYMKDLLDEAGCDHIKIFGGGGGTILPEEIKELHQYGITRIYSPDDGRSMGLEGMIEDVLQKAAPTYPPPTGEENGEDISEEIQKEIRQTSKPHGFALGKSKDIIRIAKAITAAENASLHSSHIPPPLREIEAAGASPVLGITGTGGAGKSSVTDELVRRFLNTYDDKTIAVISVDPSRKKTGGALLGDRIRMNAISSPRTYMRSLATREDNSAMSSAAKAAIDICKQHNFDLIILESAGTGQSDVSITELCDVSLYIMTPEYGAASQLEKINMLDYADVICVNKADKAGGLDALADVKKQYRRNHSLWTAKDEELPVVSSIASQFNDAGINELFSLLMEKIEASIYPPPTEEGNGENRSEELQEKGSKNENATVLKSPVGGFRGPGAVIMPASRTRYLSEISGEVRHYNQLSKEQAIVASKLYKLKGTIEILKESDSQEIVESLQDTVAKTERQLYPVCKKLVEEWPETKARYQQEFFEYDVRGKIIRQPLFTESLSGTKISKIAVPQFSDWGDILWWRVQENFPGKFPYTAGVFPLKREGEDPTRMFAGEGGPERTNRRFHYLSYGQPANRLSTAFDSVTLYGEDPAIRPDIYGKVGNSGVSIATVDDAKKLYSGFDLCDAKTSVSMTINGPAPMLLAFFLNAAIDQQCEKYILENNLREGVNAIIESKYSIESLPYYTGIDGSPVLPQKGELIGNLPQGNNGLGLRLLGISGDEVLSADVYQKLKAKALQQVRGTVQADILKEDQAQNTCIFSTEFALKLMGDVQQYFIDQKVRNFYSVSISGYHIAEAGANPVTQLAFTLANAFTYVEYYLSRGMHIDDFAPNLSFFFSNGMDAEYSVIGRVARRLWAKAIKHKYGGDSRSQKLKYHIQTSGRSLHAQEIDFNESALRYRRCTPYTTTAIACTPMLMMKPLPHLLKKAFAGLWLSS